MLGFDRALIMAKTRRQFLRYSARAGWPDEDIERIKKYKIPLSRRENLMVKVYHKAAPQ